MSYKNKQQLAIPVNPTEKTGVKATNGLWSQGTG